MPRELVEGLAAAKGRVGALARERRMLTVEMVKQHLGIDDQLALAFIEELERDKAVMPKPGEMAGLRLSERTWVPFEE
jgi:hypothetical protein